MRHQIKLRKFGRESHQRKALLRSLCTSLVKYEKIETTLAKAKDLRRVIEKAVTLAKNYNKLTAENEEQLAGMKAAKRNELSSYFHAAGDREILGRNEIKKYISNLSKENREAAEKYIKDQTAEKPAFILSYIPAIAPKTKTVVNKDGSKSTKEVRTGEKKTADGKVVKTHAERILRVEGTLTKLINRIAPRFKDVNGGYTRIYKLGTRRGDNAEMCIIEFTK